MSPWIVAALDPVGTDTTGVDWFVVITGLSGGLAVFLFGMDRMTEALRVAAGRRVRLGLARMTKNRFLGALSGAGVTAVIQSSSVTTVLVVGFISSEVMNLSQGIGVILGANVGTTVTAQVIAFSVSRYALLLVALGYGLAFFGNSDRRTVQGNLVMGLGLIFFGMSVMGAAMEPLRSYEPFIDLMAAMDNPIFAVLVGLTFTALVQSSSATTGVVIVLASEGLITTEAGVALVLGANIGTSVTAQLAALGKPPEAIRAAVQRDRCPGLAPVHRCARGAGGGNRGPAGAPDRERSHDIQPGQHRRLPGLRPPTRAAGGLARTRPSRGGAPQAQIPR